MPLRESGHPERAADHRDTLANAPRVVVVGCTGSGKTTVARSLARLLDVPHVELDSHNWEPNWTAAQTDVFRERVRDALAGDGWVVDGNYSAVRDLVWPRAALLVWLNLPYRVVLWRLLWRTLRRVFTREELWNGNREEFRTQFLSRDSLFRWQADSFRRIRRTIPAAVEQPEHAHLDVVVLRSPRGVRDWLAALAGALDQR
ncbi:MAG: adenylate kinase [Chloroflexota bacterium]|nr:adenylate kinase [Chloroflexota bacterium]MDE2941268.1 adenylate kinase [Chloroflexota bacterium]MDE3267798.1 adenylate kinase [Chloroflexota bacterium]